MEFNIETDKYGWEMIWAWHDKFSEWLPVWEIQWDDLCRLGDAIEEKRNKHRLPDVFEEAFDK